MPWKTADLATMREEFCRLASAPGANKRELMRRYGISPPTGYKWLSRHAEGGAEALADRSRRPRASPGRTPAEMERRVVGLRREFPAWGGRKLARVLSNRGVENVPSASTITEILRRHGLLAESKRETHAWKRFEREKPNELWQMDFKGDFEMRNGRRCYPLTACDDHSRFNVVLEACGDMKTGTVRGHLESAFRRYGLPEAILCDNGSPWSSNWAAGTPTRLEAWLMLLGVRVLHGRPYHPQTQGKEERFHKTLKAELLGRSAGFGDRRDCQEELAKWRGIYNWTRPHESLGMEVPGERYTVSPRGMPEDPDPDPGQWYLSDDELRKVSACGIVEYKGKRLGVGEAFGGHMVALRPRTGSDFEVWFASNRVGIFDLSENPPRLCSIRRRAGSGIGRSHTKK